MGGSSEASLTKRLAGTIFIIRVISAGLAYVAQILLARWMGGSDYGVYVYVWTWVLLLGSMMDFGISASAQKIIPEYRASGDDARLRGFLSGSRWMTFIVASLISISLAALVRVLSPWIDAGDGRAALCRLPDATGIRGRQHPGRHCTFPRLDAARTDAPVHRAAIADYRLHRRRFRAGISPQRHRRHAGQRSGGLDCHDRPVDRTKSPDRARS